MTYQLDVRFEPLYELIGSLHTYICRKSHKKIDLAPEWAQETRKRLSPELNSLLDGMEIDADWKCAYLLVYLCPDASSGERFLAWLEGLTPGALYELLSPYTSQFPENMSRFRTRILTLFSLWNEEYFLKLDPVVLQSLIKEKEQLRDRLPAQDAVEFADQATNGLWFEPADGMEKLILVPQYHFQPINVIYNFGSATLCHYAARIYPDDDGFISPHDYRVLRSLGEKSRLKILQYLHQGPRSFTEIVRYLKLSKGITHDHLFKLRGAGLIHAHFERDTLTVYSLRLSALGRIQESLLSYITKEPV
ncbi:Bacterial regulatory protein, arsR family [compost metagenome]